MARLWAHSPNDAREWHLLEDHLRGSAALAQEFGTAGGIGELAEYLALVHDVGKGCCAWQETLAQRVRERSQKPVGVPHKGAGAWLVNQRPGGFPFAATVLGHHGGLPSLQKVKDELAKLRGDHEDAQAVREAIKAVAGVVPEIEQAGPLMDPAWIRGLPAEQRQARVELRARMAFSCLVDADFLDTAAHFSAEGTPRVSAPADMALLRDRFERRRQAFVAGRAPSPVDGIRRRVYDEAVAGATGERGMYVLHVPTGGGKTLTAGGFALHHAVAHGLRRVVFAVPFISITEQNARVYRDMLEPSEADGEPPARVVLEHHSSARLDDDGQDMWARLAAENWDAPVVMTTTVQLFQSLFSNRPAAMRKLHRLASSVIVLDEVQALPDHLLVPILSVLRGLVEDYGATVVLASATQPEFWSLPHLDGLERRTLVSGTQELFEALRRVRYEWRTGPDVSLESVAEEIVQSAGPQVLAVVNTTRDSARLHRLLTDKLAEQGGGDEVPVLHLSTRMTAGHRLEVIQQIRADLAAGKRVRVVSTQLIEAGVDLDFPCVYRAWAPAESLQQAAGRCNREGRMSEGGVVVVFKAVDAGDPRDPYYTDAIEATGQFFGPQWDGASGPDPDDLDAQTAYYTKRYALHGGSSSQAMGEEIEALRAKWDYPAVAAAFQMIDDRFNQPVVVVRKSLSDEKAEQARSDLALLRSPYPCGPDPLRQLQEHTASLPRYVVNAALAQGFASPVIGDLVEWLNPDAYDDQRGLDPEEPEDRTSFLV